MQRSHKSKARRVVVEQRILAGLDRATRALRFESDGKTWDNAAMHALVAERLAATEEVRMAKARYEEAIVRERTTLARTDRDFATVCAILRLLLASEELAAFGLRRRKKRRKMTAEQILARVEKGRATRAARAARAARRA